MNTQEVIEQYIQTWNKPSEAEIKKSLQSCFATEGWYTDPFTAPLQGIQKLEGVIKGLQEHYPDIVHEVRGPISVHHGFAYYPWIARLANGKEIPGVDFLELSSDGLIKRVVSFTNQEDWQ